jgi:hypothetical protein
MLSKISPYAQLTINIRWDGEKNTGDLVPSR